MSRRNLPEHSALVIGTVKQIFDHGVYVNLDEYEDSQIKTSQFLAITSQFLHKTVSSMNPIILPGLI